MLRNAQDASLQMRLEEARLPAPRAVRLVVHLKQHRAKVLRSVDWLFVSIWRSKGCCKFATAKVRRSEATAILHTAAELVAVLRRVVLHARLQLNLSADH